jgi:all-trans-retinol 13,14-reductase
VDEPYDAVELPSGQVVPIPAGLRSYRESLEQAFPTERAAIRAYLEKVRVAASAMRDYMIARTPGRARSHAIDAVGSSAGRSLALIRTAEVVGRITDHPGLRAVLLVPWGFYGSPPERSAFGVHALMTRHYRSGAFYPVGGSMSIARALTTELARSGGWVRINAPVEQIMMRRGRVAGARLTSGEEIAAPVVIGAAGALNSLSLLPDAERAEPWVDAVQGLPSACAHVCLNVGFRGDIRTAGASRTNRWLCADDVARPWDLGERTPSVYLSFPSLKDPLARSEEGFHTAELVCLVSWEPFSRWSKTRWRARGEDYDQLKKRITDRLLTRLFARMPRLESMVAYTELSTPVSAEHFVRATRGSAYGLEATPERFSSPWLRPRTPVPGLFLAGSDVAVSGIVGALFGGVAAASAVDLPRVVEWIRGAVRPRPKTGEC